MLYSWHKPIPALPLTNIPVAIICISDTHNTKPHVPDGDILIHAGDFTQSGSFQELQDALAWLRNLTHAIKIVIAGNHELLLDSAWDDSLGQAAFERAQLDWGDIIYLENGEVTVSCPNFRQLREFDQGSIYVATYMRLQEPSGWCLTDSRRRTSVLSLQKEALRIFCLQRGS